MSCFFVFVCQCLFVRWFDCFCLSMSLCQVPFSAADLGAKKDCVTGNVLLLHSDGVVQSFRVADSKQRSDIGADKMIFFLMVFFFGDRNKLF